MTAGDKLTPQPPYAHIRCRHGFRTSGMASGQDLPHALQARSCGPHGQTEARLIALCTVAVCGSSCTDPRAKLDALIDEECLNLLGGPCAYPWRAIGDERIGNS